MTKTEIIQKTIDAINRHNSREATEYYADNVVLYDPMYPEPLKGRGPVEKDAADTFRAIPDLHITTRTIMEKDNTVAAEYTLSGTNTGPFTSPEGDIPPSGKTVNVSIAVFSHFNDQDKIVEEHRYYNVADMLG
jgi:steroid delta-isomerase-like uncharacterized protein